MFDNWPHGHARAILGTEQRGDSATDYRGSEARDMAGQACCETYARSRRFLAGAKMESSGNSATTLRLRASRPCLPITASTAIPLPKPTMALFRNPLLETPPPPSDRLSIVVVSSLRVLSDIIEQLAPHLEAHLLSNPCPCALPLPLKQDTLYRERRYG